MKKTSTIIACALLLSSSSVAWANQVTITNQSTINKPVPIQYRIAHKNTQQATVLSDLHSLTLSKGDSAAIAIALGEYQSAGITVLSIFDHQLPTSVTVYGQPNTCSITTDKEHPNQTLNIKVSQHKISCSYNLASNS